MSILAELKRRDVIRVGIAYLAVGWLVLQIADTIAPMLQLPPWVPRFVLFVLLIGFPVALLLAWTFDMTPGGIVKTSDEQHSSDFARTAGSGRKLNLLIIAALGLAVVFLLFDREAINESVDPGLSRGPIVAVLPFTNIGDDKDKEYFSDGLSEDVSTALTRFTSIRVIPASMTLEYRNNIDPKSVGDALGAAFVITGSVRLAEDTVRISARLIDIETSTQLWGETYDRELSTASLFAIQTDVAHRVVATIADTGGVLSRAGQQAFSAQSTDSLQAYSCVLRAYAYLTVHNDETHLIARDCLEQAVQVDPGYAEAWAQLGFMYREEIQHNRNRRPDSLARALSAAKHAIELDGSNPMAHFAMSMVRFSLGDYAAGMAEGEKAIALNPNDSTKALAMGVYFVLAGETDRGVELARQAESLIPSPPSWIGMVYTSANYQSGNYEEAMHELSRWGQEDNDVQWHMHKIAILAEMGQLERAGRELQKAFDLFPAFEEDPVREMRKYLLSEVTLKMYYDSLVKAGLQAELAE